MTTAVSLWDRLLADVTPADVDAMRAVCAEAETRRPLATYDTGTVSLAAAVLLHALTRTLRPQVIAEIGTFIGTSTYAMVGSAIHTCDKDNACLRSRGHVTAHQKTHSTTMLRRMLERRLPVDFWFFDGRIQDEDVYFIRELSTPNAVFAFDDYSIGVRKPGAPDKGVLNVTKLQAFYPRHELHTPPERVLTLDSLTTIAVLSPVGLL